MTSPRQAAAAARRALIALSRPSGTFDASRYFRGAADLGFYNVGTTAVRALARQIAVDHREDWTVNDALVFADALILDRHLEVKGIGIEVLARFRRQFEPRHLRAWKKWLAENHSANWATTDAICGLLIGPLLVSFPSRIRELTDWSRHPNMWVRRASVVGLLHAFRAGKALDVGYANARRLHADDEDLIQKAVGWMLREAGKSDPLRLERYLRQNGPRMPRTTVRYAIERFDAKTRADLLAATRPPTAKARARTPAGRRAHGR